MASHGCVVVVVVVVVVDHIDYQRGRSVRCAILITGKLTEGSF